MVGSQPELSRLIPIFSQNRHRKKSEKIKICRKVNKSNNISIHSRTSMDQILISNGILFIKTVILFIYCIIYLADSRKSQEKL